MTKPLDQMNTLSDMARVPWTVHLGASLNIVFSVWLTYQVFGLTHGNFIFFLPFAVTLIGLNLLPVVLRRRSEAKPDRINNLGEMNFFNDQHRFSSWVYAIASGNMLFWTVFAWWVFTLKFSLESLWSIQLFAFVITYVPLWRRLVLAK
jgi:hypothetical protein